MNYIKQSGIFLKNKMGFLGALFIALIPLILMIVPGVRSYIIGTYAVAAFYNTVVIIVYATGCVIVLSSFIEINRCDTVLKTKDDKKTAHLLGDANKIVFKKEHGLDDDTLLSVYENIDESVNRKHNQRMSAILSCANISTMIGLLGTFAGLSLTIASVISLLDKSQIGGGNDADTLKIIVNVVSSLSEPLRGMNTAFVSSIYGVVSAILLNVMSSLVRNAFVRLNVTLRDTKLEFIREMKRKHQPAKTRTLRIVSSLDEMVSDIKDTLLSFQDRLLNMCADSNNTLHSMVEQDNISHTQRAQFETSLLTVCERGAGQLNEIHQGVMNANLQLTDQHTAITATQQQVSGQHALLVSQHEQLDAQEGQLKALNLSQQDIGRSQETLLQETSSLQNSLTDLHATTQIIHEKNHLQLNKMDEHIVLHELKNTDLHSETQSHIQGHLKTFAPLFSQIADMQCSLQKDVLVLKDKKNP